MQKEWSNKLVERFLKYVSFYTESDPSSDTIPSTERQWDLAKYLHQELLDLGLENVLIDEHAYVIAALPSNTEKEVPTIGFISHMDTSPDYSGENVKPQIWKNYDGKDIVLNKDLNMLLKPSDFPELKKYIGQTIITTDGTTLLGADDKAGIAEIVTAIEYLIAHPEIKHGRIAIGFTPDEEIGSGAALFDIKKFGAKWAYTMDGSEVGELEFENFNAAGANIIFKGKSVHPGYAKDTMINAANLAREFASALPEDEVPEMTSGREGFFHLTNMSGNVSEAKLEYIIRDHDFEQFGARKKLFQEIADEIQERFSEKCVEVTIKDQYYNMRQYIEKNMKIVDIAEQAMKDLNIKPNIKPIRGGTDGASLSGRNLPCPNIFAGGHNFHGPYEYIPVESMEKAVQVIIRIAEITAE